jgi:hypothetical protein
LKLHMEFLVQVWLRVESKECHRVPLEPVRYETLWSQETPHARVANRHGLGLETGRSLYSGRRFAISCGRYE